MIEVKWEELESVPAPGPQPCGIAWDGTTLWISDENEKKLFRIDPLSGRVKYSFRYEGIPAGMAWDGKNLWQADSSAKKIDKLTRRGKIVHSINLDRVETFSGLTYDGNNLWQVDYSGTWYKIDLSVEKIENAYNWGQNVWGIAHDGSEFWYLDDTTPALVQISQLLGMSRRNYKIDGSPRDLTWDGNNFWIVDSSRQVIKKFKPE
jgi:glutamine cyclotransferase